MTNDYKDMLLKYLTGNIQDNLSPNEEIGLFSEVGYTSNNLQTYLENKFGSTFSVIGMLQSETYDNYILYGTRKTNGVDYGFLLIVDRSFNPIQLITTYDSGTLLGRFYKLAVDERNQIYGIDYNPDTTTHRFIMLNNVFASGIAKLRQSYSLPNEVSSMSDFQITKDPTSANYLIAGIVFQGNINQPKVAKLTINVGAANEWTYYEYAGTLLGADSELSNIYATWTDGTPDFKITAFSQSQFLVYSSWYYNDQTLIDVTLYDVGGNDWTMTDIYSTTSIVADINTVYYGVHAMSSNEEMLALYRVKNGTQTLINSSILTNQTTNTLLGYRLKVINGTLFFIKILPNNSNYKIISGAYKENVINQVSIERNITLSGTIYFTLFDVVNNFNLYKYNFQIGDKAYSIKLLYNQNVSFDASYEFNDHKNLKPLTMCVYSNYELAFNRNLYNLVTSGSTTTATVEVPNTILNGVPLDYKFLLGNNSLPISYNTDIITTNEYETLHINSINTLSMIDTDTSVLNQQGASRLNNSTNLTQDYDNAKANKIRVNYTDDTNYTYELGKSQITESSGVYTYTFMIYVPKTISNIEIISNDEVTTYQTITGTFEVGKYYQITQEVTI